MPTSSGLPYPNPSLSVFDTPVKKSLMQYIRQTGHDPISLDPVVIPAIEEAKKLATTLSVGSTRILRQRIEDSAKNFVAGVLSQSNKWNALRERIRSYHSVFLIGAGLSFSADLPLTRVLTDILEFVQAKSWDELRRDPDKCLKFKVQFKNICAGKQPGAAHKLITANFPKHVLEVICLNWDDFLERSAESANRRLNVQNKDSPLVATPRNVWKFHGDVRNIKKDNVRGNGGWIFPDEQGYVFGNFANYFQHSGLKGQIFTFVIAGYSENESNIYDDVIAVFEKDPPRPTYRVGLNLNNLKDEQYIVGPCDYILAQVLSQRGS